MKEGIISGFITGVVISTALLLPFIPNGTTLAGCVNYVQQAYWIKSISITGFDLMYGCNSVSNIYGVLTIPLICITIIGLTYYFFKSNSDRKHVLIGTSIAVSLTVVLTVLLLTALFTPSSALVPFIGEDNVKTSDIHVNVEEVDEGEIQIKTTSEKIDEMNVTSAVLNNWEEYNSSVFNETKLANRSKKLKDMELNESYNLNVEKQDIIIVYYETTINHHQIVYTYTEQGVWKLQDDYFVT